MKRLFFSAIAVWMMCTASVCAQTLYQAVYDKAKSVVATSKDAEEKTVSQYKLNALNYIMSVCKKEGRENDVRLLDLQAVNMESFIDDFREFSAKGEKISPAKKDEIVRCFTSASFAHPLFQNESPLVDGGAGSLLPFSLNTDWSAAYDQAETIAKRVLR